METAMTAAANIEIFLASLGIAAMLAFGALRLAFRLMVDAAGAARIAAEAGTGENAGRHYTVRQAPPSGELALVRVHGMRSQGHRAIR
jgi:hypothetical protein